MNGSSPAKKYINPLEALRELGKETLRTVNEDLAKPMAKNVFEQISGMPKSGELLPNKSVEVNNDKARENFEREEHYRKQYIVEKRLIQEDRIMVERRTNELRIQIQAIQTEVFNISEETPQLSEELQIAAFKSAAMDPSEYELNFLEDLFETIKSFRKKIHNARVWLHSANRRASKKNVWGQNFKKYGAKYLLSGEHYASRSAA